jgi:sugar (pentulose or hexulose) kinase
MGKSEPLVLAVDCGTQSLRALIFEKNGQILAQETLVYETSYLSSEPGYAEQSPEFYYQTLCQATRALKEKQPELFAKVEALVLTGIRDSVLCLNSSMRPITPCILWLDERLAECKKPMPFLYRAGFALAGMSECAAYSREHSVCNWIQQNQPEIWEQTYKFIQISGYLIYRLTGVLADSVASQIGHLPLNYKKKKWMSKWNIKYAVFNVPAEKFPALAMPGEVLGHITQGASRESGLPAGLRLIAAGSDKGCEGLGSGCIDGSTASLSFGTTCTVQLTTEKYVEPQRFLPAYPAVLPGKYNPEIQIYRGFWMVTWFKEQFARMEAQAAAGFAGTAEQMLDESLRFTPPGADGLLVQPYWGPGLKTPEARGAMIGFHSAHTREHIYRAIIEGLCYALRDGLEEMSRRAGVRPKALTANGGGAKSDAVCQIAADVFGLPVYRVQTHETSALGAAAVGFFGLGEYRSVQEAAQKMAHRKKAFLPDAQNHALYDEIYQKVYRGMYEKMRPMYRNMRGIYQAGGKK